MRRARITYPGAFHHAMNRGHGGENFLQSALKKYDRRTKPADQSKGNRRKKDRYFDPVGKVIWEFEKIKGIKIDDIDISTKEGTRQRGDLLVMLKENGDLTYKEISKFDIFEDIKMDSFRRIDSIDLSFSSPFSWPDPFSTPHDCGHNVKHRQFYLTII
jgi:hypothetical protein